MPQDSNPKSASLVLPIGFQPIPVSFARGLFLGVLLLGSSCSSPAISPSTSRNRKNKLRRALLALGGSAGSHNRRLGVCGMKSRARKKNWGRTRANVVFHLSDDPCQIKKWFSEHSKDCAASKMDSCNHADEKVEPVGVVMAAPPSRRPVADSSVRGLKRNLGCIESETCVGRKKMLEHEYILGRQIRKGRVDFVQLCQSKVNDERFACKTLSRNDEEMPP